MASEHGKRKGKKTDRKSEKMKSFHIHTSRGSHRPGKTFIISFNLCVTCQAHTHRKKHMNESTGEYLWMHFLISNRLRCFM